MEADRLELIARHKFAPSNWPRLFTRPVRVQIVLGARLYPACMHVCVRLAPTNEVAEVTDEAEREAYERTHCRPRPISGGFVGRSATSAAPLRRVQCAVPPRPPLPCWRVRPDEPTSERRSIVQRKTTKGSPGKRRPTARPERKRRFLGLSGNRLGFRGQWIDSRSARRSLRNGAWACVHRCERRQAVRPEASTALHEHRPRSAQRCRLRTIAST